MKTAVFGGAFDPVHSQHILLAKAAVEELGIERLVIVPTFLPPHKHEAEVSFLDRIEMLKIAFEGFSTEVVIDDIESKIEGKCYSAKTIPLLKQKYGDFYFLIGGDSLTHFESWFDFEDIFKSTTLAVFNRFGYPDCKPIADSFEKKYGANIKILEFKGGDASSSRIKAELYLGERAADIPDGVLEYIVQNKLYTRFNDLVEAACGMLSEKKQIHSKNVVKMAIFLSNKHNLKIPFDYIFIAAMLHDIGYSDTTVGVPKNSLGTAVAHQFSGANLAASKFSVQNEDILEAIRFHCTGSSNMTKFEKLIYTADMVSEERDFLGVDKLREAVYNNFNEGFKLCLKTSYQHLLSSGNTIYPLTKIAYDHYIVANND